MIAAADFWEQQSFHYLVTYSFNRGPKLAALETTYRALIESQQALPLDSYLQQYKLKRQLRELATEKEMAAYQRRITDAQGVFDKTAEQVAVIKQDSLVVTQLNKIFQGSGGEVLYAMCAPIFRDAIAFYDEQGQLVRTLNICFQCLYMETNDKVTVEAGVKTHEALRMLLTQLGHPIEASGW